MPSWLPEIFYLSYLLLISNGWVGCKYIVYTMSRPTTAFGQTEIGVKIKFNVAIKFSNFWSNLPTHSYLLLTCQWIKYKVKALFCQCAHFLVDLFKLYLCMQSKSLNKHSKVISSMLNPRCNTHRLIKTLFWGNSKMVCAMIGYLWCIIRKIMYISAVHESGQV